jgi:hypothetical protein
MVGTLAGEEEEAKEIAEREYDEDGLYLGTYSNFWSDSR